MSLQALFEDRSDYSDTDTSAAVTQRMSEMTRSLGLDFFSFIFLKMPFGRASSAEATLYASYPIDWIKTYLRQGYAAHDPVTDLGRQNLRPFAWGGSAFLSHFPEHQRRVFDEASDFNINHGVTFPLRGPKGDLSIFSLASERAADLRDAMEGAGGRILSAAYDTHRLVLEDAVQDMDGVSLSPREKECLSWTLEGKTAGEIAMILGISTSTVNQHAFNASQKLGCLNKHHAAVHALRWNMI